MKLIRSLVIIIVCLFLIHLPVFDGSEVSDITEDDVDIESVATSDSSSIVLHEQQAQVNLPLRYVRVPDPTPFNYCSNLLLLMFSIDLSIISLIVIMINLDRMIATYMIGFWFGLTFAILALLLTQFRL
jgi:hypothetical protein